MKLSEAFSKRVNQILREKQIKKYKLEELTGLYHSTLSYILNHKGNSCNSKSMALIIRALGMTFSEFFDSNLFDFDNLEIE